MIVTKIIAFILLSIEIGILFSTETYKYTRKYYCPYCSCRKNCNIGHNVETIIPEDKQEPMVCERKR